MFDKLLNLRFLESFGDNFQFGPEVLFGVLVIVFLVIWGLSLGRTKTAISLFGLYVSFAITAIFPFWDYLQVGENIPFHWVRVGFFIIIYILTIFIFSLSFLRKRLSSNEFSLASVLLVSTLQIGFLISIISSFLPVEVGEQYIGRLFPFFASPGALFAWSVLPLPGLLALRS